MSCLYTSNADTYYGYKECIIYENLQSNSVVIQGKCLSKRQVEVVDSLRERLEVVHHSKHLSFVGHIAFLFWLKLFDDEFQQLVGLVADTVGFLNQFLCTGSSSSSLEKILSLSYSLAWASFLSSKSLTACRKWLWMSLGGENRAYF